MSKTGHAFVRRRMRTEDAAILWRGNERASHYFRDFCLLRRDDPGCWWRSWYCLKGRSLGELVDFRMAAFPASRGNQQRGWRSRRHRAGGSAPSRKKARAVARTDGLSMSFADWRFNLRSSNTEPVVRLNVESRRYTALMEARTKILQLPIHKAALLYMEG